MDAERDERARLRRRVEELSSLIDVSRIISSTLDLPELLDRVMEMAKRVMTAEASSLMLLTETGDLAYAVATGDVGDRVMQRRVLPRGSGIAGWVAEHHKPLNIPDAYADSRFDSSWDTQTGFRTRSVLCVPLRCYDRLIGVASVYNKLAGDGRPAVFDEDDEALFSTYCDQAAIAIENARLHRAEIERERLERDMTLATRIQRSFLPQEYPERDDYEFFGMNRPSLYVGGDFYDVLAGESGDRILLQLGDVSGKGVSAALQMARLMSDFRVQAAESADPAAIVQGVNRQLARRSTSGMFATLYCALLEPASGAVTFVNAGHPPALCRRADGSIEHFGEPNNMPIGILDDTRYNAGRFELRPGDLALLYTDGITEAMNAESEMFGVERLEDLVRPEAGRLEDLAEGIAAAATGFASDGRPMDDLTLLVFRRRR